MITDNSKTNSKRTTGTQAWTALLASLAHIRDLVEERVLLRIEGETPAPNSPGIIDAEEMFSILQEMRSVGAESAFISTPDRDVSDSDQNQTAIEPFAHVATVFDLHELDRQILAFALSVELDVRFSRLVGYLNDHAGKTRPTVGLVAQVLTQATMIQPEVLASLSPRGPLTQYGLLEIDGTGPLAERSIRIPDDFWPRLAGLPVVSVPLRPVRPGYLAGLTLPDALRHEIESLLSSWRRLGLHHSPPCAVIRGPKGSGREALARALSSDLGKPTYELDILELAEVGSARFHVREAMWHGATLVIRTDGHDSKLWKHRVDIRAFDGPIVWLGATSLLEHANACCQREAIPLQLRAPDVNTRTILWRGFLPQSHRAPDINLDSVASRFRFGPGRIEKAVTLAFSRSTSLQSIDQKKSDVLVDAACLDEVCRMLPETQFSGLAQRLDCPYSREDLILAAPIWRELSMIGSWFTHGKTVLGSWGFERKVPTAKSLACLFSGPPGTGKTMAAQVLGRELGLDVYRVDLSQMISKYIGETEENLSRAFDAAEESNVVLFFDEADAVFGKRTDVKDAHDRHANVETGYLLQRLESHKGIVILATNLRTNLDDAFMRRLQIITEFPMPQTKERLRIWQRLLPDGRFCQDLDIESVAQNFALSGGEIRNAVLSAAFLACQDSDLLSMKHIAVGIWREVQKNGKLVDISKFGDSQEHVLAYSR